MIINFINYYMHKKDVLFDAHTVYCFTRLSSAQSIAILSHVQFILQDVVFIVLYIVFNKYDV